MQDLNLWTLPDGSALAARRGLLGVALGEDEDIVAEKKSKGSTKWGIPYVCVGDSLTKMYSTRGTTTTYDYEDD